MPSPVILVNDGSSFQTTTGAAAASVVALTDISPVDIQLPALFVWHTGALLRFTGYGIVSTASVAPTLTLGLYAGTNAAIGSNTSMCSASINTTASLANAVWRVEFSMRVNTIGASGTALTTGEWKFPTSNTTGVATTYMMPSIGSVSGGSATFLNGSANYIQLGATWGTAQSQSSITCYQWYMEALDT